MGVRADQADACNRAYQSLFPGKKLPPWWPRHPGTGLPLTHLYRTIDEQYGADMRRTLFDQYGLYEASDSGVELNFLDPATKGCVIVHVSKVSEGTAENKSARPLLSASSDAMSQETFGSSKVEHAKKRRAMS